jgi:hypothetical protein
MKNKLLITLICFCAYSTISFAQSDDVIAKAYMKRANGAAGNIDFEGARISFDKAMKRMDTILDKKVAALGSIIYFEVHHQRPTEKEQLEFLEKARDYSRQYFLLEKNTSSEDYLNNTEHSILILESIEILESKIQEAELERLRKEKELRKIDSLKTLWKNKSDLLTLKVDSIYAFNKNNIAVYQKEDNFGVIDDRGKILIEASEYKEAINSEGFILLLNKKEETNKIYCFNTNDKTGFLLPSASDFNSLSTHYGKIMLPRGNGRLVTYPNNSFQPMVYDLNVKQIVRISNKTELFKNLKKSDVIGKYNKDGEVKVGKTWYIFGGHLGGGIHPLYLEGNYNIDAFLCSIDGKRIYTANGLEYIGAFYNDKSQAYKKGKTMWINQNGTKVSKAKDEYADYEGDSKVVRLNEGQYQIMKNGVIVIGDAELERMGDFLRKHKGN